MGESSLKSEQDYLRVFGSIFGGFGGAVGRVFGADAVKQANAKVQKIIDRINDDIKDAAKVVEGKEAPVKNAHEQAKAAFVKGDGKVTKVKVGSFKGDFGCLSNEWLSANVTKVVTATRDAEKTFTKFTATIDKIASNFERAAGANKGAEGSLSKTLASLSKARCNLNNYYNGLIIEATSYALRYRKTVHIALKAYLHVANSNPDKEKKNSKESLQNIESMFQFDD